MNLPIILQPGATAISASVDVYPGAGVVVVAGGFFPIARLHGAYAQAGLGPLELATSAGKQLLEQAGISRNKVTDLVVGSCVPDVSHTFLAPAVRNQLGLENVSRASHVNSLCTTGGTAIANIVDALCRQGGDARVGLVLGADDQSLGRIALDNRFRKILAEVMGRDALPMEFGLAPEASDSQHPFAKFGILPEKFLEAVRIFINQYPSIIGQFQDGIVESFRDPSTPYVGYMWDTADRVAELIALTDEDAIGLGIRSHRLTCAAHDRGIFDGIVLSVPGVSLPFHQNPVRGADRRFVGRGRTAQGVHSGSSSQMGGNGAGVILMKPHEARRRGLSVLAEIVGYSFSNVPPEVMGLGPIPATEGLLKFLGLKMQQMEHIEVNEAFAGVVAAFAQYFGLWKGISELVDPRLNPWGGAIANGHVMGTKLLEMVVLATRFFELNRDKEYALCTLCGGGGEGFAIVLRNPTFVKDAKLVGLRGEKPDHELLQNVELQPVLKFLADRGYLLLGQNLQAIGESAKEIKRRNRIFPSPEDLEFVLKNSEESSLPLETLLARASEIATIRAQGIPGSSETIGQRIGVVGAGVMGHQLVLDYARAGYEVHLSDVDEMTVDRGREKIVEVLYDSVRRRLYTAEEAARILARIHVSGSMMDTARKVQEAGGTFEMIIEAATEKLSVKKRIFEGLRRIVSSGTILATNSSSITAEAAGADVVFHYFNPVHAMALVDGNLQEGLDPNIKTRLERIAANTKKACYLAAKDISGSIVNPIFATTYFSADKVVDVQNEIKKLAAPDSDIAKDPRSFAIALLDALYVEAIRSEPQALEVLLATPLSAEREGALGQMIRRNGQGLFLLVDTLGGPKTFVETADNVAQVYGSQFQAQALLREQADAIARGESRSWYPAGLNRFQYDELVRARISALQKALGSHFIEGIRREFHQEFWNRVQDLAGQMRQRGVVPESDPALLDNAVGSGLGWSSAPEAWRRSQSGGESLPPLQSVRLNFEEGGTVARITMDRPRVLNAVNEAAIRDLTAHAATVSNDPNVAVVVFDGRGKNFVAGADLAWFKARQEESVRLRAAGNEVGALAELAKIHDNFAALEIEAMAKLGGPNRLRVAVVQGDNVGGGVEMIAQADVVLVLEGLEGERTRFWMPEASLGIGIGYGAHVELVKKVGVAHAKRILLTGAGATFGATDALAMGFANRVVRRDQLPEVLAALTEAWKNRGEASKENFIQSWTGERPQPSKKLEVLEQLWSDSQAVRVMSFGVVPPWLTDEQKVLAEQQVKLVRNGSPEAIQLLNDMVDQGKRFDLRRGLIHIFDTPNARAAIAVGKPVPFKWTKKPDVVSFIQAITVSKLADTSET